MPIQRRDRALAGGPLRPPRPLPPLRPASPLRVALAAPILVALLASSAAAADLHVGPGQAHADLVEALEQALAGDRILLHAGQYVGNHEVTRPVEILGVEDGVVLEAENGTVLSLSASASGSTVSRLAVQGGTGVVGGAISAQGGAFRFERLVVREGEASVAGGGLACQDADCTLVSCAFFHNEAGSHGGGVALYGGTLSVTRGIYAGNTAGMLGGGVYAVDSSKVSVDAARVLGNTAEEGSGAGFFVGDSSGVSVTRGVYQGNHSHEMGAAISLTNSTGVVRGNLVEHNEADLDVGGIASMTSDFEISDNVVRWNKCSIAAGGIYFITTPGGTIRNNVVYGNEAGQTAGGILIEDGIGDIYNNVVAYNHAVRGGGGIMMGRGGWGTVAQNTVIGNSSGDLNTDGISAISESDFVVWNNLLVANEDSGLFGEDSREVRIAYNDSWGNGAAVMDYAGEADAEEGRNGNISADPLFESLALTGDLADDDLRIAQGSPVIDAGDPAVLDPDGSRSDIGAFGGPWGDDWADLPVDFGW